MPQHTNQTAVYVHVCPDSSTPCGHMMQQQLALLLLYSCRYLVGAFLIVDGHQQAVYTHALWHLSGWDDDWRMQCIPAGILLYPGVGVVMRELR